MKSMEDKAIVVYDDLADIYFVDEDGEPCDYQYGFAEEDFENTFDGFEGEFIVCGTVGLWDGKREGYSPKVFDSLKDAIIECNDGFYGNIRVTEEDGSLLVDVSHHDGSNSLEIRELTDVGSDMWNNYCEVGEILAVENATCKLQFRRRKRLAELEATIKYSKHCIDNAESVEEKNAWEIGLKHAIEEKQKLEEEGL